MQGERPAWRQGLPAAASLAVNALLAAALLSLGMGRGSQEQRRDPAMTVVSFAAVKGTDQGEEEAEAADPAKTNPAPQPLAAAVPPPLTPALSQSEKPAVISPPAVLPSRPAVAAASAPGAASASQQSAAQAASAAAPTAAASFARRGAADGLDVRAPSGDGRNYAARIRSWLYAHKTYPRRARMRREEGVVQVRFTVDRAGLLLEGAIVRGSGNGVLDEEAMATLRRSSPFPQAPREVVGDRIEFTVPIEFALST